MVSVEGTVRFGSTEKSGDVEPDRDFLVRFWKLLGFYRCEAGRRIEVGEGERRRGRAETKVCARN